MEFLQSISTLTWGLLWTGFWALAALWIGDGFASWLDATCRAALLFVAWRLGRVAAAHVTDGPVIYWIVVGVLFILIVIVLMQILGPIDSGHTDGSKAARAAVVLLFGVAILLVVKEPTKRSAVHGDFRGVRSHDAAWKS